MEHFMREIKKKIIADEQKRPVAVQIDYEDWQEIERELGVMATGKQVDLSRYSGKIRIVEDPLKYQQRVRAEWQ
jgi:hypothetical protein